MIPLVAPTYSKTDRARWGAALEDDWMVRAFEEEFAAYVGCRGAVAVNSGTNALIISMRALNFPPKIVLPSFSCRALLDAVYGVGQSEPVLVDNECDVGRAQFGMRLAPNRVALLPHMFGVENPRYSQNAIQDITLSLGAVHSPEFGVCSFHREKMISTGRGGMIVAQDEAFLERCRDLAYYDQPSNGKYRPAFSFGMTGMQAALGRSQLAQLPSFIERRRHVAAQYTQSFSEAGIECPDPDVDSVFFRYIVGVDDPADKVEKLAERGIEAGRGVNPPLHRLLDLDPAAFPGAEECSSKLLSVPVHPGLTDEQVEYITGQVVEVCAP